MTPAAALVLPDSFCAVLDAISAPVFAHAGAAMLHANEGFQRLLGLSGEELMAMHFSAWAAPEFRETLRDYGERSLLGHEMATIEIETVSTGGARRLFELKARCTQLDGSAVAVITCQDLSDMRHVQTSLLDMGRVLHQIIESSPMATFVIDAEHRITQWNAACTQLTGVDPYKMLGTTEAWKAFYTQPRPLVGDLIVDGQVDQHRAELALQGVRPSPAVAHAYEGEEYFPQLGGAGRWLFFTAAPLFDVQGRTIGAIETVQDVTERRAAEDELKRHRSELEQLVADRTAELLLTHHELQRFMENARVGIICTIDRRIVRSNKRFAEMFDITEEQASNRRTRDFFCSDEDYAELSRIAFPLLSQGEPLTHEMEMQALSGRRMWVQMIAYVSDPQDRKSGTWWLLLDQTEERRVQQELALNYQRIRQTNARLEEAQNQLLQSEKMASIGQLAAGVAHEINNPIGFVSSNLGSLRRYAEGLLALSSCYEQLPADGLPADLRERIAQVSREADLEFVREDLPQLLDESEDGLLRVKKIVQDLKDFSRVDQAEWQEADINAGLDSTLNVVRNEVKYKADVVKDYGVLPAVTCIAAQLNQVFMNLIVNAAHAIAGHGEIRLRTAVEGERVLVEVRDNGCGMSEEVRRRIFEPFYTTKPVGKGTGLGLSLSFSIVQKHGGHIEVESAPGQGSCFRIWVPVAGPGARVET